MRLPRGNARSGTLLIVVVGLVAVVMALALSFLARMRSDGEEGIRFGQDVQARLMLSSALMYIQETARLGWGDETYGWRDVRDGMAGPRAFNGYPPTVLAGLQDDGTGLPCFPAKGGKAARCPMYRMHRPPYAIKANVAANPVPFSDPNDTANLSLPWAQIINYKNPDPAPDATDYVDFEKGDTRPVDNDSTPAWFRVYRKDALTFVITCGAGATRGWRTYAEAVAAGDDAWGTQAAFDEARRNETILWYEAQWSDIVTGNNFLHLNYARWNVRWTGGPNTYGYEMPNLHQQGGTYAYIERLPDYPPNW